jgi:hypothetical protein
MDHLRKQLHAAVVANLTSGVIAAVPAVDRK